MHKTTIVIDDKKIARARRILGTKGIRDTIDRALDEVVAVRARRSVVQQLRALEGLERSVLLKARKEAWR
jgi:Arc/MetJ family transcription regulator